MEQIHILKFQKGWLAVDKPCRLSVHNDPGNDLVDVVSDRIRFAGSKKTNLHHI